MARKVKTMERDFWFDLNDTEADTASGNNYIDLGQVGSLVNRVSLRQGMEYVVESITLFTTGACQVAVFRLPEHWACINAWEKAYSHWKHQQDEAAREAGLQSTRASWRDFKVFLDRPHAAAGVGANLLPIGFATSSGLTPSEVYEWNPSQFVIPNDADTPGATVEAYGHMLGDSDSFSTSVGLIHEYGQSRSRPAVPDPNIVDVDAENTLYGAMENVGDNMDEIITNYQEHNHAPPYLSDIDSAYEFYPGGANQGLWDKIGSYDGQLEGVLSVNSNNTNFSSMSLPGFVAPLGLLKIAYSFDGTGLGPGPHPAGAIGTCLMRVTLSPGGYKGLLCQPMQEAN